MSADALQVFVLSEGQLLASEVFSDGVFSIGRHESCDLVLRDETIAPVHARLHYYEGKARLQVQGDSSGIYVNGERVRESVVTSADDVYVGRYLLKLRRLNRKSPNVPPVMGLVPQPESEARGEGGPRAEHPRASSPLMPTPRPGAFARPMAAPRGSAGAAAAALQPVSFAAHQSVLDHSVLADEAQEVVRPPSVPRLSAVAPAKAHEPLRDIRVFDEPREITLVPLDDASASPSGEHRLHATVVEPSSTPLAPAKSPPVRRVAAPATHAEVAPPAQRPPPVAPTKVVPVPPAAPAKVVSVPPATAKVVSVPPGVPKVAAAPIAVAKIVAPAVPVKAIATPAGPAKAAGVPPAVAKVAGGPGLPGPAKVISVPPVRAPARLIPAPPVVAPANPPKAPWKDTAKPPQERLKVTVHWGRQRLATYAFRPGQEVVAGPQEDLALPLYGFKLTAPTALARPASDGWTVHPPRGTQVAVRSAAGRWSPLAVEGVVRLATGDAVRVSSGPLQVELARAMLPARAAGRLRVDPVFCAILLLLLAVGGVLASRKPHITAAETKVEVQRMAKYVAAVNERAKPPPPPRKTPPPKPQEKAPPRPIAQASTLKAATAQLHSVDRVMSATREIDHVLEALNKVGMTAGNHRHSLASGLPELPSIPNLDRLAAPSGIGELNGPLTRGLGSLSTVDVLGAGTAGHGPVRGVPVKVPRKPSQVQGEIDRDALARVINEHVDEMRLCYERALLRDATIGAGKLTLEWTIGAAGTVTDIRTKSSTLRSPEVLSCILGVVRGLQFPRPSGGDVIVSYPILFNSVGY